MSLTTPYPADLLQVARKVVWYEKPEETLTDLTTFLTSELVCYEDLGSEAIRRLRVRDFPMTVVIDTMGNNLYETGVEEYIKMRESGHRQIL